MEEEAKAAARRASVVYNVRKTRDRNSGNGCRPCDSTQRRSVSILAWGTAEPVRHMPQRGQSDAGTAWIQPGMRRGRDADRFQSSVEERGKMNCLQCGGKLTKKWQAKYCSRECMWKYQRKRRAEASEAKRSRVCEMCGKEFIMHNPSGKARRGEVREGRFCSKRCKGEWVRQRSNKVKVVRIYTMPTCCICGKTFQGKPHFKYCSKDCELERGRRYYRKHADETNKRLREQYVPKEKSVRICGMCGCSFLTASRTAAYCSDECRLKARMGSKDARKKARNNGVFYEYVNPLKVFKRDGWRCQLCGKKLRPKHRGTIRDDAPELDHIIPWACGGEHSYRNTQCACRKCNIEKGAKELGQLRLFG